MQLQTALDLISSQGGFDPTVAQTSSIMVRSWISAMVQEAAAEAKALKQIRQFGPTVIGTKDYAVDADVIQVQGVRVNGSRPWARTTLEDLWFAEADPASSLLVGGAPGAFAPSWELEAAQDVEDVPSFVRLWPTPTAAGYDIQALCVVGHKVIDGTTLSNYPLQVPEDLARMIAVDGPIGLGLTLVHERADLAAPYLARYADGKAKWKARANSRIGKGVIYPPVARRRG